MKLPFGTALHVALEFSPTSVLDVGRLALDRGTAVLEYSPDFLASKLTVNPRLGVPGSQLVRAAEPRTFEGLHGVFADSLPDAWGNLLTRRRAAASNVDYSSLSSLDKLAAVGRRGMGALTYRPAYESTGRDDVDLDLLAKESLEVLEGHGSDVIAQLERLGGPSGGARPKVLVALNASGDVRAGTDDVPAGFAPWIVKFRSSNDVADLGPLEAAYADMARSAGVEISETKLIPSRSSGPGYFATKRFDRSDGGSRRHILSVAGALDTDFERSAMDYSALLNTVRYVTRHQAEVENMFRRMVFNVIAHNRDDHTKQHAFAMDHDGRWRLAPAYDLTFSRGPGGEHYLTIDGSGRDITAAEIASVGKSQGISSASVTAAIDQVSEAARGFRAFASTYSVSRRTTAEVVKAIERSLRALDENHS